MYLLSSIKECDNRYLWRYEVLFHSRYIRNTWCNLRPPTYRAKRETLSIQLVRVYLSKQHCHSSSNLYENCTRFSEVRMYISFQKNTPNTSYLVCNNTTSGKTRIFIFFSRNMYLLNSINHSNFKVKIKKFIFFQIWCYFTRGTTKLLSPNNVAEKIQIGR